MKIHFLGTSHGIPSADRYCSCSCIETGGKLYLIDAGAPICDLFLRLGLDITSLKALFTTHIHGDHTKGIPGLADLLNWAFPTASVDIFMTEKTAVETFKKVVSLMDEANPVNKSRVRFNLMTEEYIYDDGNIKVTPIRTCHMGEDHPSYAYLIEAENKKVLFTGDLSGGLSKKDFPEIALRESLDLTICEMAHFGIEESEYILQGYKGKMLFFNHVFPEEKIKDINALDMKWGYHIHAPEDGDIIEL